MLIDDTSAWIEFMRGTNSPAYRRMRSAIAQQEVVTIDPVLMEVMSGARRDLVARTERLLNAQHYEP